ncbi:MAG: hypothetical protein AAFX09_08855 [Pseudomonadota bacterium]
MKPVIGLRVDAGPRIGHGHAHRSLALAHALEALQVRVEVLTTTPDTLHAIFGANARSLAAGSDPFEHVKLSPDVIVIDTPRATRPAQLGAARRAWPKTPIVLIGGESHADPKADLIIHQELTGAASPAVLSGPDYLLVKPGFTALPVRQTRAAPNHALICLGGGRQDRLADVLASIDDAMRAARPPLADLKISVFSTQAESGATMSGRFALRSGVTDLASAMTGADLAILAGGGLVIEAAAAGLPALYLPVADHQNARIDTAEALGIGARLGAEPGAELLGLAADPGAREAMARNGQRLVDGLGAKRCAKRIVQLVKA